MATIHHIINTHWRIRIEWSSTQNASGNYSDVSMDVYWERHTSSGDVYSSAQKSGWIEIAGSRKTVYFYAGLSASNPSQYVGSHSVRVYHDSNGNATAKLAMSLNMGLSGVVGTINFDTTVNLPHIARTSTLTSSPSWTNGQSLPITISRHDSTFYHTVHITIGNEPFKILYDVQTSTTVHWTTSELEYLFNMANGQNLPTKITVFTFDSNGNSVGDGREYHGTMYVPTLSYLQPTGSFTIGSTVRLTPKHSIQGMTVNIGVYYIDDNNNSHFLEPINNVTDYVDWTPSQSTLDTIYSAHQNKTQVKLRFDVWTYYRGVLVKNESRNYSVTAVIAQGKPIFPSSVVSFYDGNSTTVGITGNDQRFIGGKSRLYVKIDTEPQGQNGASMKTLVIQAGGLSYTRDLTQYSAVGTYNIGVVSNTEYQTLTVRVIDSRGLETVVTKSLDVYRYNNPTASIYGARKNKFEETTTINISGTFSPLVIDGTRRNSLTLLGFHVRRKGTTSWGTMTNVTPTYYGNVFIVTPQTTSLDNTSAWELRVTARDSLGTYAYGYYEVGAGQPILFIDSDKSSVGVGKFPDSHNALEAGKVIADDTVQSPKVETSNLETSELSLDDFSMDDSGTNLYVRRNSDYVRITYGSTYIWFRTNKNTFDFNKKVVLENGLQVYGDILFQSEPTTNAREEGFCGIGAVSPYSWDGTVVCGTAVNFRTKKTYTPSSVTLKRWASSSTQLVPNTIDLSANGFWIYLTSIGSQQNIFHYWRGLYEC